MRPKHLAADAVGLTETVPVRALIAQVRAERLGPADWVTLTRATLSVGVAALVAASFRMQVPLTLLVSLASVALALDAVDGWVARRTRTTEAGARLDGEVDAFLILVLSVYVAHTVSPWVLTVGAARYGFLAAGWMLPWMRAQLPERFWRKVVAATQGIVLTVAAANLLSPGQINAALVLAAALLTESFGRDVWWLAVTHGVAVPAAHVTDKARARLDRQTPPAPPPAPQSRLRRGIAAGLTVLSVVILWAALVAPDQPRSLTLTGFLRLPLELLVLIALALVLPRTPRRVVAVIAGLALTLVVALKVINYEVFTLYNRPYDPLGDTSQLGNGIETLRSLIGGTETKVIEVGAVVGTVVLAVLLTLAMLRLTRVAADNRRWALRTIAGLAVAGAICVALGAQLIAHTPIISTVSAGLVVDEVNAVRADIRDQSVFAAQIRHDSLAGTPTSQLLTGLRGKNVLLVFVEAYGQQAVQGRSFSPEIDAVLADGNKQLKSAGFSSRSGFLKSATYGGISWLAHSSLQAGLWVDNQDRYNQLISAKRFTLAEAFKRAGWRTVDDDPSNDRPWPQGKAFYHWDAIYNRYQVGYHGPTFSYASMPDQYVFAALQRLELSQTHRKPLFAEVDTVSSHMPWNRIPQQIPWSDVGNGSIYNRIPSDHETGAFWSNPPRVQAAYGRSVVYAMSTLISFVKNYGNKNLVMIVVGDHQPLPIVSGQHANHDVPISIIAHDPKVLKQIGGWGWNPGLQPRASAPVWPMNTFRDNFLSAFDSHPATP